MFYMIQLLPDIYPKRIKFGVAQDVQARLLHHRCTCPQARVYASWPTLLRDEDTIISYVLTTRPRCKRVGEEVVDVDDLSGTQDCVDEWFEIHRGKRQSVDSPRADPTLHLALDRIQPATPRPQATRRRVIAAKMDDLANGRQLPADLTIL